MEEKIISKSIYYKKPIKVRVYKNKGVKITFENGEIFRFYTYEGYSSFKDTLNSFYRSMYEDLEISSL